jgi:putative hemolysin
MRTMKRLMVGLAVAALVAGSLVSCGNDDDESDPGLANPASEYCESIGGEVLLDEGLCRLPDGTEIDEWELYRDRDTDVTEPVPAEAVTLYFSRDGEECDEVEAVTRTVESGVTLDLVVRELVAGPDESERDAGFGSWFSADTAGMLESVEVDDGVALVSFDPELREVISGASSSCGSANLLAQLDATIEAFDGVDRALYALGGDVDAFYEWLQYDAPAR